MTNGNGALTRRDFVIGAGSAGFVLGFRLPMARAAGASTSTVFAPNAFVRINEHGGVTFVIPQVEMGQGTYTSMSMILAEELDADWKSVLVEHAPADLQLYANPLIGDQVTGNSNSIRAFWKPMRQAGATARACLVEAAAAGWNVQTSECRTDSGAVIHEASGRRVDYGALAKHAAEVTPPKDVPLKNPADFRLVGRALKRLDAPDKTNGRAIYGIDVRPAGASVATLSKSPVLGGRVVKVDDNAAKAIPGVRQIVVLDDLVAVVGSHMWAAMKGLAALEITWNDGPNGDVSSDLIWSRLRTASKRDGALAKQVGQLGDTRDMLTMEYELPLLAHAAMEPLNCTVHVTPTSAEVWIGTQVMARVQAAVARATGLTTAQVTVHNHLLGGGFGRKLEPDMAYDAARIACQVKGAVKVVWTREQDMQHDYYRPVYHDVLSARLREGRIVAWKHKVTGSAVLARFAPPAFRDGVDPDGVDSAVDIPYDIPNYRVEFNREEPPGINTTFWRGVGPNNNVFAIESFMDELARQARRDPIEFRRAHLGKSPRLQAVLDLVEEKSDWGAPLPPRCGRGVSVQPSFASFIAAVIECQVDDSGEVALRRATIAVDTGIVVNPDTVIAQLQGGIIFGLSAALYGEITLEKGRVQQSNFHDYQVLRMNQVPAIDVHLVRSGETPGGIGEAGTAAALPALRNAILAATGIALRRMPVDSAQLAKRVS
jgi:isoquinoline 1-oxidoreductase subunit beta